jgi:hypothetical protein
MKPFADEAHKTKRAKMGCITGSPANFESGADKAERLCRGGMADGGEVEATPLPASPFEEVKPIKSPRSGRAPRQPVTPPPNEM